MRRTPQSGGTPTTVERKSGTGKAGRPATTSPTYPGSLSLAARNARTRHALGRQRMLSSNLRSAARGGVPPGPARVHARLPPAIDAGSQGGNTDRHLRAPRPQGEPCLDKKPPSAWRTPLRSSPGGTSSRSRPGGAVRPAPAPRSPRRLYRTRQNCRAAAPETPGRSAGPAAAGVRSTCDRGLTARATDRSRGRRCHRGHQSRRRRCLHTLEGWDGAAVRAHPAPSDPAAGGMR